MEQQLSNEIDVRRNKIETLKKDGVIVYKDKFERTHKISEARKLSDGEKVKVCGRMVFRRVMGKFGFMQIRDLEDKIQVLLENNVSIICGFNYSYLYGNKEDTFQHVAIIVAVKSENKVLLLDPGPRDAGYKIVDIGDLFASIKKAQDGLWCIY